MKIYNATTRYCTRGYLKKEKKGVSTESHCSCLMRPRVCVCVLLKILNISPRMVKGSCLWPPQQRRWNIAAQGEKIKRRREKKGGNDTKSRASHDRARTRRPTENPPHSADVCPWFSFSFFFHLCLFTLSRLATIIYPFCQPKRRRVI